MCISSRNHGCISVRGYHTKGCFHYKCILLSCSDKPRWITLHRRIQYTISTSSAVSRGQKPLSCAQCYVRVCKCAFRRRVLSEDFSLFIQVFLQLFYTCNSRAQKRKYLTSDWHPIHESKSTNINIDGPWAPSPMTSERILYLSATHSCGWWQTRNGLKHGYLQCNISKWRTVCGGHYNNRWKETCPTLDANSCVYERLWGKLAT